MKNLDIFEKVQKYLDGDAGLSDLEDWMVAHLGQLLSLPPDPARELTGVVELGLAEMSNSQIDEAQFRQQLEEFVASQSPGGRRLRRTA